MCAQLCIACVAPSPLHNTARLYSTQFRCFSITVLQSSSSAGAALSYHGGYSCVRSFSFFSPLVSSKLTRLHHDYGPQRGFPHSSHLTRIRITTVSQIRWVLQSVISLILKTLDFVLKKCFSICCICRFCVYFEIESWRRHWIWKSRVGCYTAAIWALGGWLFHGVRWRRM